jgi:Tir chaperone protein (CesT) family
VYVQAETDLRPFQLTISALMRQLGVEGFESQLDESEDLYTVTIDEGTSVHLVGSQSGLVHLWSFPGKLSADVSRSALVILLAANGVTFDYPSVHVGVDRESGELMLWTRHPLAQLDAQALSALFERFVSLSARLRRWVESGAELPIASDFQEVSDAYLHTV